MNDYAFDIRITDTAPVASLSQATLYWRPGQPVTLRGRDEGGEWRSMLLEAPSAPVMRGALALAMALWEADAPLPQLTVGLNARQEIVWLTSENR